MSSHGFFQYFVRVLLNSQTNIFRKQNDEEASKLDNIESLGPFTCSEKTKVLKQILKKLVVPNIRSCLRTQLNQNMKYKATTGKTIGVCYIFSVFLALSMWKAPPVGEIWVEILIALVLSCAGTKIAHEFGKV